MTLAATTGISDRIPAELVRDYALGVFAPIAGEPFEELIPAIHRGPDLFYAPRAYHIEDANAWVFRRADDIREIFRDETHFSSAGAYGGSSLIGDTARAIPIEIDHPHHTAYRALLNPYFTPGRVKALGPRIRELAQSLIDRIADKGECDFIADFATPFPIGIFLEIFGLPVEEMDRFVAWEHMMVHSTDREQKAEGRRATLDYLRAALADRAANPRDDLLTIVAHAEIRGRKMTDAETLQTAITLYTGGLDTVTTSLGWHFKHLATHPDDQQRLRAEPALIPNAVEEFLRAYSPVTVPRICVKDYTTRSGVTIHAGDRVLLPTAIANRDPDAFADPDEVRLDRAAPHVAFGLGRHHCLGSQLARLELAIGIGAFLDRIPTFTRATDAPLPMYFGTIVGLKSLPLTWRPQG